MTVHERHAHNLVCPFRTVYSLNVQSSGLILGSPPCAGAQCMLWEPTPTAPGDTEPHGRCGASHALTAASMTAPRR